MAQTVNQREQHQSHAAGWRQAVSLGLLLLTCLFTMATVVVIWLHALLLNTDRFVSVTTSLSKDPAVQGAIADKVTQYLFAQVDPESSIRDALPDRMTFLAPVLTSSLERYVHDLALGLVASQVFQPSWETLLRSVHSQVVALLLGQQVAGVTIQDGAVTLELRPVTMQVVQRLNERGVSLFSGVQISSDQSQLVLFQSDALARIQDEVSWLDRFVLLLPILSLLLAAGAVALAPNPGTGLIRMGIGVAFAMVLLLLLTVVSRRMYLDTLSGDISYQVAEAVVGAVLASLQVLAMLVLTAGIILTMTVAAAIRVRRRAALRKSHPRSTCPS
jgi:hypothetical protein